MKTQKMKCTDFYNNENLVKEAKKLTLRNGAMRTLLDRQAAGNVILAKDGSTLIGWAYLVRDRSKDVDDTSFTTHVYVSPQYRNQGVGTRLLSRCKKVAKSQKRGIRGNPTTKIAKKLFEKTGIQPIYGSNYSNY